MSKIKGQVSQVLRMVNKGDSAVVYIHIEGGKEEYQIWIGGEVETIEHNQVLKAYVVPPWSRPKQSRKGIDSGKLNE